MRPTIKFLKCVCCYILLALAALVGKSMASDCTYPKHHPDKKDLKNDKMLSRVNGRSFSVTDDENEYSYEISFCKKINDAPVGMEHAGVIQTEINKKETHQKNVGNFNNATILGGTNWLMLEYLGGDHYTSHCSNESRRALILITCDTNADSSSVPLIIEENREKYDSCYYLFEYATKDICESTPIITVGLSTGTIVIIVLVCLVTLYLLIGVLYKRIALGAKGMEQIPNYEFWQDFGNLQADGCNFVCRSGGGREKRSYKGIGDDQLQEEDDRDDNLLPM